VQYAGIHPAVRRADPEIEKIAQYMRAYSIAVDQIVMEEGQHGDFMCIIITGRLRVHKDTGRGKSRKLAELSAGTSIGEMSVIDNMPHSATVVAMETTTLALLTRDSLQQLIEDAPRLGAKVLWKFAQQLSQRLRQTSGKLVDAMQ
jgi:CRP-like cAMP-binding protein